MERPVRQAYIRHHRSLDTKIKSLSSRELNKLCGSASASQRENRRKSHTGVIRLSAISERLRLSRGVKRERGKHQMPFCPLLCCTIKKCSTARAARRTADKLVNRLGRNVIKRRRTDDPVYPDESLQNLKVFAP